MGKLLCKKTVCFSPFDCTISVLAGATLSCWAWASFQGHLRKKNWPSKCSFDLVYSLQGASASRRFHDFLIFAGLSAHTKPGCSNPFCIYDLHLLYDKNIGCVFFFPDFSSEKTPFCFFFWFTFCATLRIPLAKFCASSPSPTFFVLLLLPSLLTLTHAHSIFFFLFT